MQRFFFLTQPRGWDPRERAHKHMGGQPAQARKRLTQVEKKLTQVERGAAYPEFEP